VTERLVAASGGQLELIRASENGSHSAQAVIERVRAGSRDRLRAIRLRALQDSPDAFATTLADVVAWPPEKWDQLLQHESTATFVASLDGSDVGLVRCAPHAELPTAAYLISMWVAPEVRRKGIGVQLVDAVVEWARGSGFSQLMLDVAELNHGAIALYSRAGFVRTGKTGTLPPPRQHLREFQMALELGA
jgi:ribosomal protein S18 acetylase RimI-like enzyme